jgi:hypothetical protein
MVRRGNLAAASPREFDELATHSGRLRGHELRGHELRGHELRGHELRGHELREHMLREHGRTARETDGLPLEDLHRFEHVEQAMGLNDLRHQHAPDSHGLPRLHPVGHQAQRRP